MCPSWPCILGGRAETLFSLVLNTWAKWTEKDNAEIHQNIENESPRSWAQGIKRQKDYQYWTGRLITKKNFSHTLKSRYVLWFSAIHYFLRDYIFKLHYWHTFFLFFSFFFFNWWWILSYIEMRQPWVYMCSPSRSPLPYISSLKITCNG